MDDTTNGRSGRLPWRLLSCLASWDERPSWTTEERRVLVRLLLLSMCGVQQLVFAVTIPFFGMALLGGFILTGACWMAREIAWLRRTDWLLVGIFQPLPVTICTYVNYVNLAEALDKDAYQLATEDDLEQSVEKSLADRISAISGVLLDCLVVVLSFALAESVLVLRRSLTGEEDVDKPWILQLGTPIPTTSATTSATPRALRYSKDGVSDAWTPDPSFVQDVSFKRASFHGGMRRSAGGIIGADEVGDSWSSPTPSFTQGASFKRASFGGELL